MPKHIKITGDDEKLALGQQIVDGWRDDNIDRQPWLKNLPRWLEAYQGKPSEKDEPWEGASNLFVPIGKIAIDAIHPRLMSALLKPTPIVGFRPQEPADIELSDRWEKFLDYAVREECNIFPVLDRAILGMLVNGIQVVKATWDLETRNIRDTHEFDASTDITEAIQAVLAKEQAFAEAISRVTDEEYEVVLKGRKLKIDVEQKGNKVCIYTEREEVIKDCPAVTLIDPEDFACDTDCGYDLQRADHNYHRYWLTMDRIRRHVKTGFFNATKEELEKLDAGSDESIDPDDNTLDVKQIREDITGVNLTSREGDPAKVELLDAYIRYDIDDDGYDEEIIVTVPRLMPSILLRVHRLEDVYRHGMRPFTMFYLAPTSGTIWSAGLPQITESLQQEFNVIHNQRVDAGTINNTPWGWYQPAAGFKNERIPVEPGMMVPVNDVAQVKMHQPGNFHTASMQEENLLLMYLERLTKVNDLTIGRIGEAQGAARTATGVNALSAQQASGFDIYIRRVQEGFKQLLQQIMALYKQYMPPGKTYRISGKMNEPDLVFSRSDLTGKMDMIFTGNSLSTDREIERNTVTFLAQSAMNPQVLSFLMQIGITDPRGIGEWYRHLMTVFDVPRFERILKTPAIPEILPPDQIVSQLLSGVKLMPKPGEDHQQVIMLLQEKVLAPGAMALDPEILVLMSQQLKLRETAMQQAMLQQAIQQAVQQMMMQQQPPYVGGLGGAPPQPPSMARGLTY